MATINHFIISMEEFLNELHAQFPTNAQLASVRSKFNMFKETTPSMILDEFRTCVDEYKENIMNKDDAFIKDSSLATDYGINTVWELCSDNTKSAIWMHLQQLVLLSDNIKGKAENVFNMAENALPFLKPDTMDSLTSIAKGVESKMKGKKPTVQDILGDADTMSSIMSMANDIVKSMEKNNSRLQ